MAKVLDTKQANRLAIVAYHVDAQKMSITIEIQAQLLQEDGTVKNSYSWPSLTIEGAGVQTAMANAGTRLVKTVLTAAKAPQEVIAQIEAAMTANPEMAAQAYYTATRDGLYDQL